MKFTYIFVAALILLPAIEGSSQPEFVAHEWGTFTSLQRSNGDRLGGLEREEEALPAFAHSISRESGWGQGCERITTLFGNHTQLAMPAWVFDVVDPPDSIVFGCKGSIPRHMRNVTIKMETPVIYFYSGKEREVNVKVGFDGGSISQWYPQRKQGEILDAGESLDFSKPYNGFIEWDATILAPNSTVGLSNPPEQETPQWVAPRATASNMLLAGNNETEKFLFYRGIGNFDQPVKVEFNQQGNLLVTNWGDEPLTYVLVYEKKPGENARIWWSGRMPEHYVQSVMPAGQASDDGTIDRHLAEFENALVKAGLYADEAKAMLNTWQQSYFEKEGLRVFWIAPRSFTERILPIQITPKPDVLERVIVGRSEVITPTQEYILFELGGDVFYNMYKDDRFFSAYQNLRFQDTAPPQLTSTNESGKIEDLVEELFQFNMSPNPFNDRFAINGKLAMDIDLQIKVYTNPL